MARDNVTSIIKSNGIKRRAEQIITIPDLYMDNSTFAILI